MPHATATSGPRHFKLLLALPKFGIVLLVVAVVALLWQLNQSEREEERASLIKDVLWLEQNARFHLSSNEEQLQQLASDLSLGHPAPQTFRVRALQMLKNNPDMVQVIWFDAHRRIVDARPAYKPVDAEQESFGPAVTQKAFELASRLGKRVYSEPFLLSGNVAHIEIAVPMFVDQQFTGALIAVYQLDNLLDNLVPWWFAEKYQVVIVDDNERQYAAKSQIQGTPSESYELPFDPPGYGLKFKVTAYQTAVNPLQRILAAIILILSAGILWSLWLVRDLMKKRWLAEEALQSEHAFRKAMEDSLTVGMRARDLEGKIIYVNPAFCQMTGFSQEELVGSIPPMPYWVPEQMDETYALHRAVLAGNAPIDGFEITFMRKSGERFQALVYEARLIDGKGQHTGWMASVLDITERKRAEELARQQQAQLEFTSRLITMGEIASTMAHELNQPLSAIASYNAGCLNLLSADDFDPHEIRVALEKLGLQAERAGRIIRRVYDFVHKSEPKRAPCRLDAVIEDCLGFLEPEARKRHIRIVSELAPIPEIMADRVMLEHVLLNLMRNAMEAMADTPPEQRVLRLSAGLDGQNLRIGVSDRGCGIPEDIRDKLFTAFFTTKATGMGIGLSICRSIIEFHRGQLWAEDNPDGPGTCFNLTLPLEAP